MVLVLKVTIDNCIIYIRKDCGAVGYINLSKRGHNLSLSGSETPEHVV